MDIFKSTILNINTLSNFILHELIICDNRDPPWFNKNLKISIQEKKATFKNYCNSSSSIDLKSCFEMSLYQLK